MLPNAFSINELALNFLCKLTARLTLALRQASADALKSGGERLSKGNYDEIRIRNRWRGVYFLASCV